MYDGWLSFGGNELINNARVWAYNQALAITNLKCGPCPTLVRAVKDEPYTTPAADDAPWYDPAVPESADFAGVFGLRINGMSNAVSGQQRIDLPGGGAIMSPLRRGPKEIAVDGVMLAKTEQALSYGFAWLAAATRGIQCGPPCTGQQLCFFTSCPTPCPPPDEGQPDTCGDAQYRTMLDTGLISPPVERSRRKVPGGYIAEVSFGFSGGNSFIWRDPILLHTGPTGGTQLPNYSDPGIPPECTETADCVRDPLCPQPLAPLLPPPAVDLCYPTTPFTARRWLIPLPPANLPVWHEKVPFIRINPGGFDLRRLTIRWYVNPLNRDCATQLDPCSACAEIQVPYLPRSSWFTLDGRTETAWVDCPGGPGLAQAYPPIYGRGGSPFQWPVFSCDVPMCLEILALDSSVAPDARWEISTVVREEAV